jgi:hypothetical protein
LATVQSPTGGLIVARSASKGRVWSDRLLKPARGHNLSAADVVLLPGRQAMITYVDEVFRRGRLARTKVVSRRGPNDGVRWNAVRLIASADQKLRLAPNIAANDSRVTIVVQVGQLDGSPRNILASRLR